LGTKRHNVVDQNGIPLALVLSGANVHDSKEHDHSWSSLVVRRPRPDVLEQNGCEDKAYDFPACRKTLAKKRYIVHIPHRGLGTENRKRHPARRWVVERTGRWINLFRALKIRYCRKATNYEALVHFANAIICFRMARSWN
jgi:putative transposase